MLVEEPRFPSRQSDKLAGACLGAVEGASSNIVSAWKGPYLILSHQCSWLLEYATGHIMRLLHTTEYMFQEFFDQDIPAFAILSHCWGDDEVSFQEMQFLLLSEENKRVVLTPSLLSAEAKVHGQGYRKVLEFCKRAASKGHDWAWIDTVCIDKTSSAELSEAINSMFKWYSKAKVCYAYLQDISADPPDHPNKLDDRLKAAFQRSRWHTRGWCLQELIAPSSVVFFNRNWRILGRRDDSGSADDESMNVLTVEISEATRIRASVLRNGPLTSCSVSERMSWAANRSTSRIEDVAYCLMGLFDVNMPLLYGEGQRAFLRLQEEIMKTQNDHTLFAWHNEPEDGPGRFSSMLALSPASFKHGRNYLPLPTPRLQPRIPAMTRHGLQIELEVFCKPSGAIIEVLDCASKANWPRFRLGIALAEPYSFEDDLFDTAQEDEPKTKTFRESYGIARDNILTSPTSVFHLDETRIRAGKHFENYVPSISSLRLLHLPVSYNRLQTETRPHISRIGSPDNVTAVYFRAMPDGYSVSEAWGKDWSPESRTLRLEQKLGAVMMKSKDNLDFVVFISQTSEGNMHCKINFWDKLRQEYNFDYDHFKQLLAATKDLWIGSRPGEASTLSGRTMVQGAVHKAARPLGTLWVADMRLFLIRNGESPKPL